MTANHTKTQGSMSDDNENSPEDSLKPDRVIEKARNINQNQNLSSIDVALLDELFHGPRPVLTGVDADSTYCFLLEAVEHRDEDTWGWYLLEASAQGLNPDYTIADAGSGIRAGQKAAWDDIACHGDVWHIFDQGKALCRNLAKKAQGATTQRQKLEYSMEVAKLKGKGNKLSAKLTQARKIFLRKHLNSDYLDLLRFFLNHRTFMTSRVPERVGKSPTELMTGEKHLHWLELLGFELFQRA